jgi:hypothetical protein
MALEGEFLLSRPLSGPSLRCLKLWRSSTKSKGHESRNIINSLWDVGSEEEDGPWALWMKETAFWALIWIFRTFGLNRWGFGESDLVYDIDEEET